MKIDMVSHAVLAVDLPFHIEALVCAKGEILTATHPGGCMLSSSLTWKRKNEDVN